MGALITNIGLSKIALSTEQEPLKITHFAVGDGGGNPIVPSKDMTSLVNEKYRDLINNKFSDEDNNIIFQSILKANAPISEDIYIRELGLFDDDGDLIIISDTIEQYRPATGSIDPLSLKYNTSIKVDNAESVFINIDEQAFATVDALQRLTNMVNELSNTTNELITSRNNFINSCVGIEKWFNTDNQYKGQNLVKIGVKTYALMETGNILNIADYQTAFNNCGAVDNGDGTFQVPVMHPNSTTKHLLSVNARELGTYEEDAMQKITGFFGNVNIGPGSESSGVFKDNPNSGIKASNPFGDASSDRVLTGISFDSSRVARTDTETRMKNTAGQWYLLVKIDL